MNDKKTLEISQNPNFIKLVKIRSRYSWFLTSLMMLVYFGFIYLVAFHKDFLATPMASGVTTLSIPIGLGVIVFTILLTAIYVRRANSQFDDLTHEILKETK